MTDDSKPKSTESDNRYRSIVESTQEGIWIVDKDLRTTYVNAMMAAMLDTTVDDLIGSSLLDWVDEEDREVAQARVRRRWEGINERTECAYRSALGRRVHVLVSGTLVEESDGRGPEAMALVTDVSELRAAEQALRASEEWFRAVVQHSSDLVLVLAASGTIKYASPSVERVLGHPRGNVLGKQLTDLIEARTPAWLTETLEGPDRTGPETPRHAEVLFSHADGSTRVFELRFTNLLDHPAVAGIVVNGRDVTDGRQFEIELQHQALHDVVTGLPNRVLLSDRLRQAIHRARGSSRSITVMFIDIDNFNVINDSMGHEAGDQLLIGVGERLRQVVRSGDTVARFGGDEFVVVCEGLSGSQAGVLAQRLLAAISTPIALLGRNVVVTASVGVVNTDLGERNQESTGETILRDADAAMYRAKESGRAGVVVFEEEMRQRADDRLDLEQDLRLALDRGELWCAYQPIVSLVDGSVVGLEALARWTSPTRGLLSPAAFIPIAEATGLIAPLGEQILLEACRQVALWQPEHRQLTVAVNVSARQFADETFPTKVAAVLAETRLDPGALHLEITETTMMFDVRAAIRQVARLHDLGVQLAIDDFGTGWSSLGQITKLAPDCLKVDKSFVDGLGQDAEARTLVASIIGLARALGVELIAEGVETELQIAELQALGAELAQGYYFSRPLPAVELQAWLSGCGRDVGRITAATLLDLHEWAGQTPIS